MTDPGPDLLFLMIDTARLLRVEADKRARAHGMTRAQWGILIRLERQPGLSQKELAELLEVEPITAARLVDRLEARGMLERRADPRDRRVWRLHLLAPGRAMLREIDIQRRDMAALLTSGLSPAIVAALTEGLLHVKSVLASAGRRGDAGVSSFAPVPLAAAPEIA